MAGRTPEGADLYDAVAYDHAEKTADHHALHKGFTNIVIFLVGKDEEKFVVHKDILCVQSGSFTAAFEEERLRSAYYVLRLPDDHPEVITAFLYWIYRKQLFLPCHLFEPGVEPLAGCYGLLAKLWVLSDKYYITALQNDIIDAIVACRSRSGYKRIPPEIISFVYENTSQASSPIRMLLVRIADKEFSQEELKKIDFSFPAEFLFDMWQRCLSVIETLKCSHFTEPDFDLESSVCADLHYHGGIDYDKSRICLLIKTYDQYIRIK